MSLDIPPPSYPSRYKQTSEKSGESTWVSLKVAGKTIRTEKDVITQLLKKQIPYKQKPLSNFDIFQYPAKSYLNPQGQKPQDYENQLRSMSVDQLTKIACIGKENLDTINKIIKEKTDRKDALLQHHQQQKQQLIHSLFKDCVGDEIYSSACIKAGDDRKTITQKVAKLVEILPKELDGKWDGYNTFLHHSQNIKTAFEKIFTKNNSNKHTQLQIHQWKETLNELIDFYKLPTNGQHVSIAIGSILNEQAVENPNSTTQNKQQALGSLPEGSTLKPRPFSEENPLHTQPQNTPEPNRADEKNHSPSKKALKLLDDLRNKLNQLKAINLKKGQDLEAKLENDIKNIETKNSSTKDQDLNTCLNLHKIDIEATLEEERVNAGSVSLEKLKIKNRPKNLKEKYNNIRSNQWDKAKAALDETDEKTTEAEKLQALGKAIEETHKLTSGEVGQAIINQELARYSLKQKGNKNPSTSEIKIEIESIDKNKWSNLKEDVIDDPEWNRLVVERLKKAAHKQLQGTKNSGYHQLHQWLNDNSDLKQYLNSITELTLSMQMQSPPMHFETPRITNPSDFGNMLYFGSQKPNSEDQEGITVYPAIYHGKNVMEKGRLYF